MKFLVCALLMSVAVQAAPSLGFHRYGVVPIAALPTQGKYHAQDELGQYSFGHHEPNQVRSETRDAFGIVRGSYSYTNADGSIVTNNYIADENGFRSSLAPSNGPLKPLTGKLPKAPIAAVQVATQPVHVVAQPTVYAAAPETVEISAAVAPLAAPVAVAPVAAPVAVASVAAPVAVAPVADPAPVVKVEPQVVKYSGAHVAPALPSYTYAYPGYSAYHAYPYSAYYSPSYVYAHAPAW